jgi:hypothetical protein
MILSLKDSSLPWANSHRLPRGHPQWRGAPLGASLCSLACCQSNDDDDEEEEEDEEEDDEDDDDNIMKMMITMMINKVMTMMKTMIIIMMKMKDDIGQHDDDDSMILKIIILVFIIIYDSAYQPPHTRYSIQIIVNISIIVHTLLQICLSPLQSKVLMRFLRNFFL